MLKLLAQRAEAEQALMYAREKRRAPVGRKTAGDAKPATVRVLS